MENVAINYKLEYNNTLLTANENWIIGSKKNGEATFAQPEDTEYINVAVHSGDFHSDDVLAVAMMELFAGVSPTAVVRTRDEAQLSKVDLRIDVGEGLLDHHGKQLFVHGISAATKVFALLRQSGFLSYDNHDGSGYLHSLSERQLAALADLVDRVAEVDTGDHEARGHWIISMVQSFNRHYFVTGRDCFSDAVEAVKTAILRELEVIEAEEKAEKIALQTIREQHEYSFITFPEEAKAARCKELIHAAKAKALYFVSIAPEGGEWRVLCCADPEQEFDDPKKLAFSSRCLIPERFRGLRGEELAAVSCHRSAVFCHAGGFIAGFKNIEDATGFAAQCASEAHI